MAKKKFWVGILAASIFGMLVSCAIVPRAKVGEVVEGTITAVIDASTQKYNLKYDPAAAEFWGAFYTEPMWIRDKTGKLYFVQTPGRELSRGLQQHFFLSDDDAKRENLKVGGKVAYQVYAVADVAGYAKVATDVTIFKGKIWED
jgi:hypothetical protein